MNTIESVKEFHTTGNVPVESRPCIPDSERVALRIRLLAEELDELRDAAYGKNLVEVLDALVDLQYVLSGTVLEFGLQGVFEAAFADVHDSNMSKFCDTTLEAKNAADHYTFHDKNPVEAYYRKVGKKFVILRSSDDKVLKGLKFRRPNLKKILDNYLEAAK